MAYLIFLIKNATSFNDMAMIFIKGRLNVRNKNIQRLLTVFLRT